MLIKYKIFITTSIQATPGFCYCFLLVKPRVQLHCRENVNDPLQTHIWEAGLPQENSLHPTTKDSAERRQESSHLYSLLFKFSPPNPWSLSLLVSLSPSLAVKFLSSPPFKTLAVLALGQWTNQGADLQREEEEAFPLKVALLSLSSIRLASL